MDYFEGRGPVRAVPGEGCKVPVWILGSSLFGAPDTAAAQIRAFVERTGADELMITCNMHDHAARLRSYEIAAGLMAAPA